MEGLGSSLVSAADYLRFHPSLTPTERRRLESVAHEEAQKLVEDGAQLLTDDEYPEPLAQAVPNASPAIYVYGQAECLYGPTIGIVGTRNATPYGKACAQKFAEALAAAGLTIISGGALGIDAAAHRGALAVGGRTAAVLAGGIESVYPAIHAALFRQIREQGCLVSHYAVGSNLMDYKFLERNALIAALSQALLVVQAPVRSGALSTAREAAELGREVFVVPSNIDAQEFRGSFNLIRDGATLVYHPDQILEVYGQRAKPAEPDSEVSSLGERILAILGMEPLAAERIVERTGIPAGEVLSELTMLELDGLVIRDAGGYLVKP